MNLTNEQPSQEDLMQFEQSRNQLMGVSGQKQQLQAQTNLLGKSLEELDKTTEKKVYKAVGNILILSDVIQTKKELKETKESIDLRVKTLQKQEDILVQKLNKIRAKIQGKPAEEETETKKNSKTKK
ncbi:prefoldin subunit [Candidatus Micrarchaeota archaeon]|nr:prefoldin subunit [Candidatus Micrarchaeota archaeon]MBU1930332.1 prefoldin subunit [Candidatus Micrarchaeota archaeon]